MERWLALGCVWLIVSACGRDETPAPGNAAPPAAATAPADAPKLPAPTPVVAAPTAVVRPADNPCAHPALQTIDVEMGVIAKTPWDLQLTYASVDDKRQGPGFMFLLHSGDRRWETRRDSNNWARPVMWHGFCWRGVERPKLRAPHVQVQIAPSCKDGKLVETGSCTQAFKQ